MIFFRRLIIVLAIFLFTLIDANMLILDKNCATPIYKDNYFIIACSNKVLKISNKLKIETIEQNKIKPIEVFNGDKKSYLLDENNILYKIENNLKLNKIKKINLDNNTIFNPDSLDKWSYIEKNILYLSLMSVDNFPIVVKFNLLNNEEKIYKIKLKNFEPLMHIKYQDKDLVFCRNIKKLCDVIYDLNNNKIFYKSNYSGFYMVKETNGTLRTIGFDYISKKLFIMSFKDNKFYSKRVFDIFLIPHFVIGNDNIAIYGNLMKQKDGKSKALAKYNTKNRSLFLYDDAPFYVLPLKMYNNDFKALFVYDKKVSKIYIFNSVGKLIKTLETSKPLSPSFSKLFIIDSKIYLWNFDDLVKKFYLNKMAEIKGTDDNNPLNLKSSKK